MDYTPHITVATVIEKDNRFLMVEELIQGKKVINQPAGHLERDERLVDAAIRETLEETARSVDITGLVGIYHWAPQQSDNLFLRACFKGTVSSHHPKLSLDTGIIQALWLSYDEIIHSDCRSPMVVKCIDDYLTGREHPLSLLEHLCP